MPEAAGTALEAADAAPQAVGRLAVNGEELVPHRSGALWWPAERMLVVADMHLEKGSAFARRGVMLPPYDSAATLEALAAVVAELDPRRVLALGDSFHDREAGARFGDRDRARLAAIGRGRELIWIAGNHDPVLPAGLPGEVHVDVRVRGLNFVHEPRPGSPAGEVAGHLHPVARIVEKGRSLRRRCFAADGLRLVLPAFGAFAGGLNVADRAFEGLFAPEGFRAWMLGRLRSYPVGRHRLLPD